MYNLIGKKLILLGEQGGIPSQAMEHVFAGSGGEIVLSATIKEQKKNVVVSKAVQKHIRDIVDKFGTADTVVVLGTASTHSTEAYAEAVTVGDPTFSGVLGGVALELPVYYIFELQIREQVDAAIFKEEISAAEEKINVAQLNELVSEIRDLHGKNITLVVD